MFESDSENQSSPEELLLCNLAPPKQQKQVTTFKPINSVLKKGMDREINARAKKQKSNRCKRENRSRSRDRCREGRRYGEGGKQNLAEGNTFGSIRVGSQQSHKEGDYQVIEISDDEESKVYDKFQALGRSIYQPIKLQPTDALNWRERRKLDRLLERGLRYFIEGKPRDQLSFQVFNTIEDYFR